MNGSACVLECWFTGQVRVRGDVFSGLCFHLLFFTFYGPPGTYTHIKGRYERAISSWDSSSLNIICLTNENIQTLQVLHEAGPTCTWCTAIRMLGRKTWSLASAGITHAVPAAWKSKKAMVPWQGMTSHTRARQDGSDRKKRHRRRKKMNSCTKQGPPH